MIHHGGLSSIVVVDKRPDHTVEEVEEGDEEETELDEGGTLVLRQFSEDLRWV